MSNALQRDLVKLVDAVEGASAGRERAWGQKLHLMPPVGWLNDPNGLCQKDGVFHAYFQYAPFDVQGGVKMWGHCTSIDLVTWTYEGCALYPDEPFDCHGVYSGSAFVHDGRVSMFYTGNVKLPDAEGVHDYVNTGRVSSTVMVDTVDGAQFGEKLLLMTNDDYPADLTCHVRDPKVWEANVPCGRYLMVQGARRHVEAGSTREVPGATERACLTERLHGPSSRFDTGEVLVFASDDLIGWHLQSRITSQDRLGFMWECPDYLDIAGVHVLSVSPQGLMGDEWERRNLYQSGYFIVDGDICSEHELGEFRLWDAGFDFYAPQTFEAEDGRRILIGWMGMPDEPTYGNDPTVAEGWQHCLTIPRELTVGEGGVVRQLPVREVAALRSAGLHAKASLRIEEAASVLDLELHDVTSACSVCLGGALHLSWEAGPSGTPAPFEMRFADTARSGAGCGRTVRWEPLERVECVRVLVDTSSVEVFVNDGELVMSTRWYPDRRSLEVDAPGAAIDCWELDIA